MNPFQVSGMDKRVKSILIIYVLTVLFSLILIPGIARKIPVISFIAQKLQLLELKIYDTHMDSKETYPSSDKIVVIAIDEESEQRLGPFPWRRSKHAKLIERLHATGAKVIAFDMFFPQSKNVEDDAKMVEAAQKAGNVLCVEFITIDKDGKAKRVKNFPGLDAVLAGKGFPEVNRDDDHVIRKIKMHKPVYKSIPPFFIAILKQYKGIKEKYQYYPKSRAFRFGSVDIPVEENTNVLVNYCGKSYTTISYADVIENKFDPEKVKEKIVLVISKTDPRDRFKIPKTMSKPGSNRTNVLFGGEIHANAIQTVLEEQFIRHPSDFYIWLVGAALCAIAMAFIVKLNYLKAVPLVILEITGFFFLCRYLFKSGNIWLDFTRPSFTVLIFWSGVFLYESRRVKEIITSILPGKVADRLLSSSRDTQLGGSACIASVMFTDIRGFTSLSEKLQPNEVLNLLNEFHGAISGVIKENKGATFDYAGDGTLVVFGAPEKLKNHGEWAVKAAIRMQEEIDQLNIELADQDLPELRMGAGICTGEVACGMMGQEDHKKYTVIGDVVNTASRLQGLSDKLGCSTIIDSATRQALGDAYRVTDLGEVPVKGKEKPVKVYGIKQISKKTEDKKINDRIE